MHEFVFKVLCGWGELINVCDSYLMGMVSLEITIVLVPAPLGIPDQPPNTGSYKVDTPQTEGSGRLLFKGLHPF